MSTTKTNVEIEAWIKDWLSKETGKDVNSFQSDEQFANFGISSAQGVVFSGDLSDWLNADLDPSLIWDYPTIEELAHFIVNEISDA